MHLYKLYGYVPPQVVWIFKRSCLKWEQTLKFENGYGLQRPGLKEYGFRRQNMETGVRN